MLDGVGECRSVLFLDYYWEAIVSLLTQVVCLLAPVKIIYVCLCVYRNQIHLLLINDTMALQFVSIHGYASFTIYLIDVFLPSTECTQHVQCSRSQPTSKTTGQFGQLANFSYMHVHYIYASPHMLQITRRHTPRMLVQSI